MQAITGEAQRLPAFCPHVSVPEEALLIHGVQPTVMCQQLEALADEAKGANGNKLRKDARILLAGVVSYPKRMREFSEHPLKDKEFRQWLTQSRRFLRDHFGKDLRSAVVHLDESHPHIHFYCHQDLALDLTLDLKRAHPGLRKEAQLRQQLKRKPKKRELASSNSEGLAQFQDAFFHAVSNDFGHQRTTLKRQRLKQSAFKEQRQAQRQIDQLQQRQVKIEDLEEHVQVLTQDIETQQQTITRLQHYTHQLERLVKKFCYKAKANSQKLLSTLTYSR